MQEADARRNDRIRKWAQIIAESSPEPEPDLKIDDEDSTHGSATSDREGAPDEESSESESNVADA